MSTLDLNKLIQDLANATCVAFMFDDAEDNGSCNFDTPMMKIKLSRKEKEQMKDFLTPVDMRGYRDHYFVEIPLKGQANRRTTMAEAAARFLKAEGYEASVYYQLD